MDSMLEAKASEGYEGPRRITHAQFLDEIRAQGVDRNDAALICPICSTVQSMRSLVAAGVPEDKVDSYFGFSCEGRWTKAGPFNPKKPSKARGCDWSLGGLFRLHNLEVIVDGEDEPRPCFEVATAEQARALRVLSLSQTKG